MGRAAALKPLMERAMERIEKSDETGCWLWRGSVTHEGYAQFSVGHSLSRFAHRWMYEQLVGPIPDGLQLDHLCRVRNCVNPDHLEPVTPGENLRRSNLFQVLADKAAARTHCGNGHLLADHAYPRRTKYKNGTFACRACQRERNRKAYLRRKAEAEASGE